MPRKRIRNLRRCLGFVLLSCVLCGCSSTGSWMMGTPAIPVNRVPSDIRFPENKDNLVDISMTRLRQDPPSNYLLDSGDVLGIYIKGVLGVDDQPPPVHFPENGDEPPAIGFPVPVREDGTIALPSISDLYVAGKTIEETTALIRQEYTINTGILKQGEERIIVTLMRKRQFRVLVVREESGGVQEVSKRGAGFTVDLDAYENDVLHALNATGGMPGTDAQNEIVIYRGLYKDGQHYDEVVAQIRAGQLPCECPYPVPDDPNVVRIPLRYQPSDSPRFDQTDIILQNGDIVLIQSRDREVYYTGGAIRGGEHPLPRDHDLDVLGAIARANGNLGSAGMGLGGIGTGNVNPQTGAGKSPSQAIVIRKLGNGQQVAIRVDLNRAVTDPGQRLLIQPQDTIIVQYTLAEELYNAAISLFQVNYFLNGIN